MFKWLPLLWTNLWRRKTRTVLTMLSVVASFTLFGLLDSFRHAVETYGDDYANALVVQFPTWSFGPPAMLKGWFDRIFGPGIAMDLSDPAQAKPMLLHIRRITGISTYGRPRWQAIGMADPPRKIIKRYLPWFTGGKAKVRYYALYHMNTATLARRERFLAKVRREMARL